MIPLIVISRDDKSVRKYIKSILEENNVKPYYFFEISPEKDRLGIEEIKCVIKESRYSIREKRLFSIAGFNLATLEAQNAFLKTLEENNNNNIYILSANSPAGILPTVLSRSKVIKLADSTVNGPDINDLLDNILASPDLAGFGDSRLISGKKETALNIIDSVIQYFYRNPKISPEKFAFISAYALSLRSKLSDYNLNPQLTIDMLLIFIYKNYTIKKDE